jgi:hypothetical protein
LDRPSNLHLPSLAQLALSLVVIAVLWGLAFSTLALGMIGLMTGSQAFGDPVSIFLLGGALAVTGLLVLPSIYYPLMRILGRQAFDSRPLLSRLKPGLWIIALPPVILLGHLVVTQDVLAWLLLPPLHVLAVGIPTAWMLYLALQKLPTGSSQRMWGVFDSGLTLAPFLIMLFEVLAALGFLMLFVVYLVSRPELVDALMEISTRLREVESPELAIQILSPILSNPLVIGSLVLFGALIVPLVEELFKPIGVWLLAGRRLTPAAGFAAGALSGAGYGFIESLLLSGNAQDWTAVVLARIGTSAVHILTTGLVGWALVQAWQRRRYLRLLMAYTCSVLIHGLWNGLTLTFSFEMLAQVQDLPLRLGFIRPLGTIAPLGLALLAMGCFLGLIGANRLLRSDQADRLPPPRPELAQSPSGESML